jgi:hypothetical protein
MRTDIENLDALMLLTQERIKGMQENPKLGSARKVQALVKSSPLQTPSAWHHWRCVS